MRDRILLAMTSRVFLSLINLVIIWSGVNSILDMIPTLSNASNDMVILENIAEGYATILIAYGVAAEERSTLMEFLKLYPVYRTPVQVATDHVCHHYGLFLLLLGLFVELCSELVKLPNAIVNTQGIESLMFGVAAALTAVSIGTIFRFTWLIAVPRHNT